MKARRAGRVAGLLALGVLLGLGSAWAVLRWGIRAQPAVRAGAWQTDRAVGSVGAGLYTRAVVARAALLALDRSETLYFVALRDDRGESLRTRCTYEIVGRPPPARWWSVTAYGDDYFLLDSAERRYSFNRDTVSLLPDGGFRVVTGPTPRPGDWLPTPGDRGLVLTLRLYNPSDELVRAPERLDPPRIVPIGACP